MSTGLLVLRLVVGLILAAHGAQKLFGWWGGYGIGGTGGWLASLGFRPGATMAVITGLAEVAGGLGLALGLLTPLAAAVVLGTMAVAAWTHAASGLWASNGGYELAVINAAVAVALAFTGAGQYSIDNALGLTWGNGYAIGAVALGLVAALVAIAGAKAALKSDIRNAATDAVPATA
jgi:putative oxidoreductase